MFAKNKREAGEVYWKLAIDGHVGSQQIFIREFVPLVKLADGLNGLPISEEYRFFMYGKEIVGAGFYWSSHTDELERKYDPMIEVPMDFINKIAEIVSRHVRFWVVDVARKADGTWMVVELNDGQQAGLSDTDPDLFYRRLASLLQGELLQSGF
jgi:hypothetical protein